MRRWGSEMNTDDFISKMWMWDWICPSSKENGSYTHFIKFFSNMLPSYKG